MDALSIDRVRRASRPSMLPTLAAPATILLFVAAVSCAEGKMLPAASAQVVPGAPDAAAAEAGGVRISANGDDWSAAPTDLSTELTPVKVRIVNHSGAPAVIEYDQFALLGSHGHVYHAIPIVPLDHRTPLDRAGTITPVYAASKFFIAPRFHDVYPSLSPWPKALARDARADDQEYHEWGDDLPTRAMQRMGLPEGVLANGGEISGFLYFQNATEHERHLTLRADLDAAPTGDRLARLEIPFRVQ